MGVWLRSLTKNLSLRDGVGHDQPVLALGPVTAVYFRNLTAAQFKHDREIEVVDGMADPPADYRPITAKEARAAGDLPRFRKQALAQIRHLYERGARVSARLDELREAAADEKDPDRRHEIATKIFREEQTLKHTASLLDTEVAAAKRMGVTSEELGAIMARPKAEPALPPVSVVEPPPPVSVVEPPPVAVEAFDTEVAPMVVEPTSKKKKG